MFWLITTKRRKTKIVIGNLLQQDEAKLQRSPWQKQVSDWLTRSTISSIKPSNWNEFRSSVRLNEIPWIICSEEMLSEFKRFRWFVSSSLFPNCRELFWLLDWFEIFESKKDWLERFGEKKDWFERFEAFDAKQDWFWGHELSTTFSNDLQPLIKRCVDCSNANCLKLNLDCSKLNYLSYWPRNWNFYLREAKPEDERLD